MSGSPKSSLKLYRDIMRLIRHMAGTSSPKAGQLKLIVTNGFRANKNVTDPAQLHHLKQMAERGLSNYLIFQTSKTDPKIAAHAAEVDKFEDDEEGRLVRIVEQRPLVTYPHKRPSAAAQAAGEIEPHLQSAAAAAESVKKGAKGKIAKVDASTNSRELAESTFRAHGTGTRGPPTGSREPVR